MENLEDIFRQAQRKIMGRTEMIQEDNAKELDKEIRYIEMEMLSILEKYRFSYRLQDEVDAQFDELKESLLKMNNGQTTRMAEALIQNLNILNRKMQEPDHELQEDEKQAEIQNSFSKIRGDNEETAHRNKSVENEQHIDECVKNIFTNISRKISRYIEEGQALSLNMRAVTDIQEVKQICYQRCKNHANRLHNESIDSTSQMIYRELENLEFEINEQEKMNSKQNKEKLELSNPWALPDTRRSEINENSARLAQESIKKMEDSKNNEDMSLPDDILI